MKIVFWIIVIIIVLHLIKTKVLFPMKNKKLLKESIFRTDNLKAYVNEFVKGKELSEDSMNVLASMIYMDSLTSLMWDYHYRKNFIKLKVLDASSRDSLKQAAIIIKIKKYLEENSNGKIMYSMHCDELLKDTQMKCYQYIAPSASLYGH